MPDARVGLPAGEIGNVIAKAVISSNGLNADSIKIHEYFCPSDY
ncbi:MAG TPA: hypothetical protein VGC97_17725 [Pyrinomonadaceae bacterium]|jgi:hypothetical protein